MEYGSRDAKLWSGDLRKTQMIDGLAGLRNDNVNLRFSDTGAEILNANYACVVCMHVWMCACGVHVCVCVSVHAYRLFSQSSHCYC